MILSQIPTVQTDDFVSCGSQACDLLIHCVSTFDTRIDEERMSKAFRLSLDAEPILGCRLRESWLRQCWQRRNDLEHTVFCELTEADDINLAVTEYLATPLDPTKEVIQARIFRNTYDTLCIKMSHIVSDAGGVKKYMHILADIYQRIGSTPTYQPNSNTHGNRSIHQITEQFSIGQKLKISGIVFRDFLSEIYPPRNWSMPIRKADKTDKPKKSFVIHRIDGQRYKLITDYAKKHGYTLNDILVTAFFRALYLQIQPKSNTPLRLGTTVDLRRYLPTKEGDALCNLAAMFMLNIGPSLGDNFQDTLEKVHSRLNKHKSNFIGMEDKRYLFFDMKLLPFAFAKGSMIIYQLLKLLIGPKTLPPWLTNMGRIDNKPLDFGQIKVTNAFLTAPIAYYPFFIVGLSSYDNSLTMSSGFCNSETNRQLVTELFENVESELSSLTD